jgi:exonuclease VII small subunit
MSAVAPMTVAEARAALARAQDAVLQLEQADDFCHTNGSWARAMQVVREAQDALAAAEERAA